jgi:hypothetical protein
MPLLGRQPYGLAVEPRADGTYRLYVAAFGSDLVSVVEVDPARPQEARVLFALGRERK